MCGIAGYSLVASSPLERTLAAQALLAGIAERGADAVGYAHRSPGEPVSVHKQLSGASALLDEIRVPGSATEVLVHVRDYTKGHPTVAANNHPIRHGSVVGVHNGVIFNDDELLAAHECARCEPGMTVDSEAIFAVVAHSDGDAEALEDLRGSRATAWIDERRERPLRVQRGGDRRRRSPLDGPWPRPRSRPYLLIRALLRPCQDPTIASRRRGPIMKGALRRAVRRERR